LLKEAVLPGEFCDLTLSFDSTLRTDRLTDAGDGMCTVVAMAVVLAAVGAAAAATSMPLNARSFASVL
jgi:hypothetical protein